ncbi:MAG: fibrobacter succinogenes major paralogous domain-containing protein [Flammeovirgaceae bacterium]|nr:fibrobacter succinogenes major paralogous domain-containing protein [Flammeovirgaceae bacterium]
MKKSPKLLFLNYFVLFFLMLSIWSCSKDDSNSGPNLATVSFDGFSYHPIKIGEQIWLKENLRSKKFCNGEPIPYAKDNGWWDGPGTGASGEWLESLEMENPAYCYYKDSIYYANIYGNLYNGYAVFNASGICPCEYHVPTKAEWQELINFWAELISLRLNLKRWDMTIGKFTTFQIPTTSQIIAVNLLHLQVV